MARHKPKRYMKSYIIRHQSKDYVPKGKDDLVKIIYPSATVRQSSDGYTVMHKNNALGGLADSSEGAWQSAYEATRPPKRATATTLAESRR